MSFRQGLRRAARVGAAMLTVLLILSLPGCISQQTGAIVRNEPPPTTQAIESAYNARVAGLDRVWARAIVRFQSVDRDGNEIDEQGEGHLQIVQPRSLFLTVGKLGEPAFELGSNDARYWWIDIRNKSARVGEHAKATPTLAARAGLPVHPLDLLELLGITPLKAKSPPTWSADGRAVEVLIAGRWGERVLRLDPARLEPMEIELRGQDGRVLALARLTEYEGAIVGGDPSPVARVATRVFVDVPSTSTKVTLWLREPENRGSKIKARAFNFDSLSQEYGVKSVGSIDEPAPPRGTER